MYSEYDYRVDALLVPMKLCVSVCDTTVIVTVTVTVTTTVTALLICDREMIVRVLAITSTTSSTTVVPRFPILSPPPLQKGRFPKYVPKCIYSARVISQIMYKALSVSWGEQVQNLSRGPLGISNKNLGNIEPKKELAPCLIVLLPSSG